ncbi:MAG: HNH endonuclease [Humibacillus sp.]|nr:HNH endonuclease [Humibacillus sp.]MDN5775836.1 HNH endonuclease [Humibacillus sp.]
MVDLDRLSALYRARDAGRVSLNQKQLPLFERALRRQVAQHVLTRRLPMLVAELLEAAADDLAPVTSVDEAPTVSDLEAEASDELRRFEAVEHCKAALDAVAVESLGRLHADIDAAETARFAALGRSTPPGWVDPERLTVMEVCTATGLGERDVFARVRLGSARGAAATDLRARLWAGTVNLHRACTIHTETQGLADEAALGVADAVLRPKDGAPPSAALFRQRLNRCVIAADRDAAERRRAARKRRRGVYARIDEDGLGTMTITNDAEKVIAAMERVNAAARAARQSGDERDLETLRAEVATDLLAFGGLAPDVVPTDQSSSADPDPETAPAGDQQRTDEPGSVDDQASGHSRTHSGARHSRGPAPKEAARVGRPPAAAVWVVVPFTTAVGLTDAPCEIPGYGWVPADQARRIMLAAGSTWQRLAVDVDTGAALQLETTAYRPTAAMRAQVMAVDGTCRGPGCTVPANRCDLDHDTPWPAGPTHVSNLTAKERQHHNLRTHEHWSATRDPDGAVHWRTAAARVYTTYPKDWLEGLREPGRPSEAAAQRPVSDPKPIEPADDRPPF